MKAKSTTTGGDMPTRLYEVAVLPQKIDVGDVSGVIIAVHLNTPNQLGTGNQGDAQDMSLNDVYPNLVKCFEPTSDQIHFQHDVVASLDEKPNWKSGGAVRGDALRGYVLFRMDMTPDRHGRVQHPSKAHCAVSCYFAR